MPKKRVNLLEWNQFSADFSSISEVGWRSAHAESTEVPFGCLRCCHVFERLFSCRYLACGGTWECTGNLDLFLLVIFYFLPWDSSRFFTTIWENMFGSLFPTTVSMQIQGRRWSKIKRGHHQSYSW